MVSDFRRHQASEAQRLSAYVRVDEHIVRPRATRRLPRLFASVRVPRLCQPWPNVDGQPVRWVLNLLHHAGLSDRVYGPNLTMKICAGAVEKGIPLYFYGTNPETLSPLRDALEKKFPGIIIAGMEPSRFRRLTPKEKEEVAQRIQASGAGIVFVGLGCPRQETFAYEFRETLSMPILAVGAAFPFLAGMLPQAPQWMQDAGLEWFFRLVVEPRRLWRRYLFLNPAYLCLVAVPALRLFHFPTDGRAPTSELLYG